MKFISSRASAKFFGESKMTFLVQKDCVELIFKIKRGYISQYQFILSLRVGCYWRAYGRFWNRLKGMHNYKDVLARLKKTCPLAVNIFTNTVSPHFAYLDKEQTQGAVVLEMKAPVQTNSVSDYLHEKVVEKAMELMNYNLNLYCELDEKCPFPAWRDDFEKLK